MKLIIFNGSSIISLGYWLFFFFFFLFRFISQSLTRQRPRERSRTRPESRSFPPSVIAYLSRTEGVSSPENGQEEEESFFERPPPPPPPLPPPALTVSQQQAQTQIEQTAVGLTKAEDVDGKIEIRDSTNERETSEELVRYSQIRILRLFIRSFIPFFVRSLLSCLILSWYFNGSYSKTLFHYFWEK